MVKRIIHLLALLLTVVCVGCSSPEELMKERATQTVHDWLEWKYNPIGGINYSDENVVAMERKYGGWEVSYMAKISCMARLYKDKIESVRESAFFSLEYRPSEDRLVITDLTLIPNNNE